MSNNLNLPRSRLESKQKNLIKVLEQLKTSLNRPQCRPTGSTTGEEREAVGDGFELERCLDLEKRVRKKLDGLVHALHMYEEVK